MIKIITTGGTIDKTYQPLTGKLTFTSSYIPEIIHNANLTTSVNITSIMQKDSLEMTSSDRDTMLETTQNTTQNKIIITHGTDTMVESAKFLSHITNKVVIFTGAMIPYSIQKSDAIFNIGFALSCVQLLQNGVYIAMNGKVFDYDKVVKNLSLGVFETNK